jgi:hypothetical protein
MNQAWVSLFLCVAAASCASPPPAQTPASAPPIARNIGAAEVVFDEAVTLSEAGRYAEACAKFEESDRLDHAINTLFNLGDCYERVGRLASAWEAFTRVGGEARQAGKDALKEDATRRAEALKPRVAKLMLVVPPAASGIAGVQLERNGVVVDRQLWNQSVPVDAGEQKIVVTAPGKAPWRETISIREAEAAKITVPELAGAHIPGQRIGALAAGGVGVAGLLVGTIFGALTFAKWGEAVDACGGPKGQHTNCPTPAKLTDASAIGASANSLATVSNIGFAVGGAGLVAAGILWFTTPADAASRANAAWRIDIGPAGPGSFGGEVRGRF